MKSVSIAARLMILLTVAAPSVSLADWTDAASDSISIADSPTKGSAIDRRDTDMMLQAQKTRTNEDCKMAQRQQWPKMDAFWNDGRVLTDSEFRRSEKKIEKVAKFAERVANFYKRKFDRARPYAEDRRIRPCVSNPPTGEKSYPSSHAAIAYATGCVLAKIYPEKQKALMAEAEYIANLRWIVGVHHPSDVDAGKVIGLATCRLAVD